MTDGWTPLPTWKEEPPLKCNVCDVVYVGRELGYMPNFCERDGCPCAPERPDPVEVMPVHGPLDTAPGGRREDECARLRGALEAIARHCKLGGTEAGWTAYAVRDTLRVCERALGGPPMSLAKHDADCIRRGDHLPTSLCTCGLTDEQVVRARGENTT